MNEKKFKPGHIVQLKSGGPDMTVVRYEPEDSLQVTCTWFKEGQNVDERSFHEDLLVSAEEPEDYY